MTPEILDSTTAVDQLDDDDATTVALAGTSSTTAVALTGILDTLAECLDDARSAALPHLRLEALADLRMGIDEAIRADVIGAHCDGLSWTSIGAALGITRQGAAKVYGADAQAAKDRQLRERLGIAGHERAAS